MTSIYLMKSNLLKYFSLTKILKYYTKNFQVKQHHSAMKSHIKIRIYHLSSNNTLLYKNTIQQQSLHSHTVKAITNKVVVFLNSIENFIKNKFQTDFKIQIVQIKKRRNKIVSKGIKLKMILLMMMTNFYHR